MATQNNELTDFEKDRQAMHAQHLAIIAQSEAKVAARESAIAKLADLGLTVEEIASL